MIEYKSGASSDVGRVRPVNQDRYLLGEDIFAVADGMGGHVGGEVAAQLAVDVLKDAFEKDKTSNGLLNAVKEANLAVWNKGLDDISLRGMGTTLTAGVLIKEKADSLLLVLAHVGDSRAYLLRGSKLVKLTDDHTLIEELLRRGKINSAQALHDRRRHTLTRALGIEPDVAVDLKQVRLLPGDRIILCSDGLTNEVSEKEIASTLAKGQDPAKVAADLVALARAHGGNDNITAVVIVIEKTDRQDIQNADKSLSADGVLLDKNARKKQVIYETDVTEPREKKENVPSALSFKTILFFIVLGAIIITAMLVIRVYASDAYFVGVYKGKVAIYSGEPDGVFWFSPKLVSVSNVNVQSLSPTEASAVQRGVIESSYVQANDLVNTLKKQQNYVVATVQGNS